MKVISAKKKLKKRRNVDITVGAFKSALIQSRILSSQIANVRQDVQSRKEKKKKIKEKSQLRTDSSVILLCKPQSWLFRGRDCEMETCILRENKIVSTKLRILFHVLFVGVGLCWSKIKGPDHLGRDGARRRDPFTREYVFFL